MFISFRNIKNSKKLLKKTIRNVFNKCVDIFLMWSLIVFFSIKWSIFFCLFEFFFDVGGTPFLSQTLPQFNKERCSAPNNLFHGHFSYEILRRFIKFIMREVFGRMCHKNVQHSKAFPSKHRRNNRKCFSLSDLRDGKV